MKESGFAAPEMKKQNRSNYPKAEAAPFPEFADPIEAVKGFGRLFNRVVKNVSERIV